jgi:16S rRNA (cytidine1402-2'-O)-methyltransferase
MPGTLYLVATPIGNLQDMTLRGLETLRSVDLIACEDTRHTLKLLNHFRISNRLISYHEHNEMERSEELVERLVNGESIAIVSDAGTPGICDPAFRVVQRAVEVGAQVISIPGAVAFVSAAVSAGIATDSLFFGGFLPPKKGDRRKRLAEIANIPATLLLYEAPHRLTKALADCLEVLGDRNAAVARELTKLHEEIARGTLSELLTRYSSEKVKGEIVLVIGRNTGGEPARDHGGGRSDLKSRMDELEAQGLSNKAALKQAAKEFGLSKREAYKLILSQG